MVLTDTRKVKILTRLLSSQVTHRNKRASSFSFVDCVTQCFCRGNHLYNPNGLLNFFLLKGRLTNGYNIRTAKWTQFW